MTTLDRVLEALDHPTQRPLEPVRFAPGDDGLPGSASWYHRHVWSRSVR